MLARADLAAWRPEAAARRLEDALPRNLLSPALWLDLARAKVAVESFEQAVEAASMAQRLHPTSDAVSYDAAVILFQSGAAREALTALSRTVELAPNRATEVYDLAWSVVGKGDLIRRLVVPDTAAGWRAYSRYARESREGEISPAWAGLARRGPTAVDRLEHVDFLVRLGRGSEAHQVWTQAYGASGDNLIFNGSFESDSVGRGFDWILRPSDGARTAIIEDREAPQGRRVLEITFNGSNAHYHHAYQFVPVEGGRRYRLGALVRSHEVTSLSLPRLIVRGQFGCTMARIDGRGFGGTIPWSEESLEFSTPPECQVIIVQFRRERTERFDRMITGRVWVDRVELTAVGEERS
jgi:tetratricopeptide (TPR) repeat protein